MNQPLSPSNAPPDPPDPRTCIVSITPARSRDDRWTVRVGEGEHAGASGVQSPPTRGRAVARLSRRRIGELGLSPGQPWTEQLAAKLARIAAFDQALDAAMHRLNRRAMTRAMLERKLAELDHDPSTRQAVVDHLTEAGLIDDQAFGRALIRDTQLAKPAGAHLLRKKLREKGVDRDLAERLIAEQAPAADDQRQAALDLVRRRQATMGDLNKTTQMRRLQGLLARRGFDLELSRDVLQTLWNEGDTR